MEQLKNVNTRFNLIISNICTRKLYDAGALWTSSSNQSLNHALQLLLSVNCLWVAYKHGGQNVIHFDSCYVVLLHNTSIIIISYNNLVKGCLETIHNIIETNWQNIE